MNLLPPADYPRVTPLLDAVPLNTLFARSVIERQVAGRVYVDDLQSPRAAYVAHPYGMSLLFGMTDDDGFNAALQGYLTDAGARRAAEWLQVHPDDWSVRLEHWLGERLAPEGGPVQPTGSVLVGRHVRVNFRFDRARFEAVKAGLSLPPDCSLCTDAAWLYDAMQGSVVPSAFWDSAEAFASGGMASAVLHHGALASTAFASFALGEALELGIETVGRFRGRGHAVHACAALIERCLQAGLEPVWACRLGNQASYRLALRLGFEHLRSVPYYQLPHLPARREHQRRD